MKPHPYRQTVKLNFRYADQIGIMFFANIFDLAHDVYEGFLDHMEIPWEEWFDNPAWAAPIRHTEADFVTPLRPPGPFEVTLLIDEIRESAFTVKYVFRKGETVHAEVKTVHAFLDKGTRGKMPIPPSVRSRLESYRQACGS